MNINKQNQMELNLLVFIISTITNCSIYVGHWPPNVTLRSASGLQATYLWTPSCLLSEHELNM